MPANLSLQPVERRVISKYLLLLVLLVVPHTLRIQQSFMTDNSFIRYDLIALSWVLFRAYGSTIAGPFDTMGLSLPDAVTIFWGALALPPSVFIFFAVRRASLGEPRNQSTWLAAVCLALWFFILVGYSVGSIDFLSTTTIPFPAQQAGAAAVAMLHAPKKREQN